MDWTNRDEVLEKVKKEGILIRRAARFLDDKEICLEACKNDCLAYLYISNEMKKNKDIVLELLKSNVQLFENIAIWDGFENIDDEFVYDILKIFKNPFELTNCLHFIENEFTRLNFYKIILKYLEKTDFIYEYRIEVLNKMKLEELDKFFNERYTKDDCDIIF